ncbi:hypothetical protein, partial [Brachyspira pilosicoli]|uniref:hypothetical protein n=1 Tax=Brachyspira pilosicoli TaxID=52584 RepID=UPI001CA560D9
VRAAGKRTIKNLYKIVVLIYTKVFKSVKKYFLSFCLWGLAPTPPLLLLPQRSKKAAFFIRIYDFKL